MGKTLGITFIFSILFCILISKAGFSFGYQRQEGAPAAAFKKVMIVIFENTDYKKALEQPFFAKLAHEGGLMTRFFAETHPSQANYIALTSGSTQGVSGDGLVDLNVKHIGDLLEAKGKTWKVYAESYPGGCFLGAQSDTYVRKHNPFVSYKNIQNNPSRCANIVNGAELTQDIQRSSLPDFSLYIPDLNNDGHDTGVEYADQWFSKFFGPILQDRHFIQDMLFVTTFDESGWFGGNQIYTSFYGDSIVPGSTSNNRYDHYSLLRTIEDALGLGTLGLDDAKASAISGVWK